MIVTVKRNKKRKYIKYISFFVVILMFFAYYSHMSEKLEKEQKIELAKKIEKAQKKKNKKILEDAIYSEIKKDVYLLGQENVRHVRLLKGKLIIICEPNTNLEALKVRYGAMALTKKNLNEIIVVIDLKYIIESKLNEK